MPHQLTALSKIYIYKGPNLCIQATTDLANVDLAPRLQACEAEVDIRSLVPSCAFFAILQQPWDVKVSTQALGSPA